MTTSTPPDLLVNPIPVSRAADEQADEALQRHADRLVVSRKHTLLEELLDRWCEHPPTQVLAWLEMQIASGSAAHE